MDSVIHPGKKEAVLTCEVLRKHTVGDNVLECCDDV